MKMGGVVSLIGLVVFLGILAYEKKITKRNDLKRKL